MKRRAFISTAVGGALGAGVLVATETAEAAPKVARNQAYGCQVCGNITQMRHAGRPALVCCGKPMTLLVDGDSHCKFLSPGGKPEAVFPLEAKEITVREYCTIHGLWRN